MYHSPPLTKSRYEKIFLLSIALYFIVIGAEAMFNTNSLVRIKEQNPENNFTSVYPNPTTNTISINYKTTAKEYTVKIYDATGKLVKNEAHISSAETTINVGDLSEGIYLLNVFDGKESVTRRFVKQ